MLYAYADGSGQRGQSETITLAMLIASESVWEKFKPKWKAVLDDYEISYFHMSPAMSLKKEFSCENGWTKQKVNELVLRLWNVIGQFRAVHQLATGSNLTGSTCTVVMADYEKAKQENPKLRKPEAICVQYCMNIVPRDLDENTKRPEMVVTFDRNEPFLHTFNRVWQNLRNKPDVGWPSQIKKITKGESPQEYPLQAADLLAWVMNKRDQGEASPYPDMSYIALEHYHEVYNYKKILKDFSMDE